MRSLRRATWTSGDPVSPSCVLYVPMTVGLAVLGQCHVCVLHARPRSRVDVSPTSRRPFSHRNSTQILPQNNDRMQNPGAARPGRASATSRPPGPQQPDRSRSPRPRGAPQDVEARRAPCRARRDGRPASVSVTAGRSGRAAASGTRRCEAAAPSLLDRRERRPPGRRRKPPARVRRRAARCAPAPSRCPEVVRERPHVEPGRTARAGAGPGFPRPMRGRRAA